MVGVGEELRGDGRVVVLSEYFRRGVVLQVQLSIHPGIASGRTCLAAGKAGSADKLALGLLLLGSPVWMVALLFSY